MYYPFEGGGSTRNGRRAWLLVTDPELRTVELPNPPQRLMAARDGRTGPKNGFSVTQNGTRFELPPPCADELVRLVELKFEAPVNMCERE